MKDNLVDLPLLALENSFLQCEEFEFFSEFFSFDFFARFTNLENHHFCRQILFLQISFSNFTVKREKTSGINNLLETPSAVPNDEIQILNDEIQNHVFSIRNDQISNVFYLDYSKHSCNLNPTLY